MKVISVQNLTNEKITSSLFTAPVKLQIPFADSDESDLSIAYVTFPNGAHNKFHKHSTDQVLIVTKGEGFVATEKKKYPIKKGDIVLIPAGEVHKHGAREGKNFTHIAITRTNSKLTQVQR